ncbi:hypothetical protein OC834_006341 [Tilletia horrida]|nr:hypothetical protein OC834_006341 [Tilletia horrida]
MSGNPLLRFAAASSRLDAALDELEDASQGAGFDIDLFSTVMRRLQNRRPRLPSVHTQPSPSSSGAPVSSAPALLCPALHSPTVRSAGDLPSTTSAASSPSALNSSVSPVASGQAEATLLSAAPAPAASALLSAAPAPAASALLLAAPAPAASTTPSPSPASSSALAAAGFTDPGTPSVSSLVGLSSTRRVSTEVAGVPAAPRARPVLARLVFDAIEIPAPPRRQGGRPAHPSRLASLPSLLPPPGPLVTLEISSGSEEEEESDELHGFGGCARLRERYSSATPRGDALPQRGQDKQQDEENLKNEPLSDYSWPFSDDALEATMRAADCSLGREAGRR